MNCGVGSHKNTQASHAGVRQQRRAQVGRQRAVVLPGNNNHGTLESEANAASL